MERKTRKAIAQLLGPIMALLLVRITVAQETGPAVNLQDLERRIEEAKRHQTKQDAAGKAESLRKRTPAEATKSRLLVDTDESCELFVDDAAAGVLTQGSSHEIVLAQGEHEVECVSVTLSEVRESRRVTVIGGSQASVAFNLHASLEAERACAADQKCVVETKEKEVLRQPSTGLEWTKRDNGRDIDFKGAIRYCTELGDGWRLPDSWEINSVYDDSGRYETVCLRSDDGSILNCRVSPKFSLSGIFYWARAQPDLEWVQIYALHEEFVHEGKTMKPEFEKTVEASFEMGRALCVRRRRQGNRSS